MAEQGKHIAFIGGIRSGKSAAAQARFMADLGALKLSRPVYLGTLLSAAAPQDAETQARLDAHRRSRPEAWATVEVGTDLAAAGRRCIEAGYDGWFLDGLGAWAALHLEQPQAALAQVERFLSRTQQAKLCVWVLDEAGQGGVPGHPAARAFADLNGTLNQSICAAADEVYSVQAGLPMRLK